MDVKQFCNRSVTTVSRDTDLRSAARLMADQGATALVVMDSERPEGKECPGLLTDRDLMAWGFGPDPGGRECGLDEIMTAQPLLAAESEDLWETVSRMRRASVHHVLVTDDAGRWKGVLALADVLTWFATAMPALRGLISPEWDHGARL